MRGLSRQFRRRVADDLEMFTNQPFTTPLELGDVGSLERGRFETSTASTLAGLGIDKGAPLVGAPFSIRWLSNRQGATNLTMKAKGAPPMAGLAEAEMGVHFRFGRKGSYYFEAQDAVITRIAETPALFRKIAQARRQGQISRHDRIVMEVLQARRAKLFIAETRDAELTLSASAEFKSLVDAGVVFNVRRSRGSVLTVEIDSEKDVTFFMKLVRVRRLGAVAPVRAIELASAIPLIPSADEGKNDVEDDDAFVLETIFARDEEDLDDDE